MQSRFSIIYIDSDYCADKKIEPSKLKEFHEDFKKHVIECLKAGRFNKDFKRNRYENLPKNSCYEALRRDLLTMATHSNIICLVEFELLPNDGVRFLSIDYFRVMHFLAMNLTIPLIRIPEKYSNDLDAFATPLKFDPPLDYLPPSLSPLQQNSFLKSEPITYEKKPEEKIRCCVIS